MKKILNFFGINTENKPEPITIEDVKNIEKLTKMKVDYNNYRIALDRLNQNDTISNAEKAAIGSHILHESGGDPTATDGFVEGILQWSKTRRHAPKLTGNDSIDVVNQLDYGIETLHNGNTTEDWSHGGDGTGYQTAKEAKEDFKNQTSVEGKTKAMSYGYVRPGKNKKETIDKANERITSAKLLLELFDGKQNKQKLGGSTPINNMKYRDRFEVGRNTINSISTGSQIRTNFKNGGRVKADLGSAAMWTNMGLGLVNTLAQGITGSAIGKKTREMYENLKRKSTFVPVAREHINTKVDVNPQLDAVRNAQYQTERAIDVNTNSSKNTIARKQVASINSLANIQNIYSDKINRETQLRNAEAELQTRYNLVDNQNKIADINEQNNFEMQKEIGINNAKTTAANTWSQSISSGLSTIGGAIGDYAKQLYTLAGSKNKEIADFAAKKLGLVDNNLDTNNILNKMNSQNYIDEYNKNAANVNPMHENIKLGYNERIMKDNNGQYYIINTWNGKKTKINNLPNIINTNNSLTTNTYIG